MAYVSSNLICWKSCALLKCNYSKIGSAYIIWVNEWRIATFKDYSINFEKYLYARTYSKCTGNFSSWEIWDLFYTKCQHVVFTSQVFKYVRFWAAHPNLGIFLLHWFHLLQLNHHHSSAWNTHVWMRFLPAGRGPAAKSPRVHNFWLGK